MKKAEEGEGSMRLRKTRAEEGEIRDKKAEIGACGGRGRRSKKGGRGRGRLRRKRQRKEKSEEEEGRVRSRRREENL